jgi:hypothetical protein
MQVMLRMWGGLAAFLLVAALSVSVADATAAARVSGAVRGDYARVTFHWPEPVKFRTQASGKTLTITFEQPLGGNPSGALSGIAPYVERMALSPDGRSVTLTMKEAYTTRSFVSGNASGVDLLNIRKPAASTPVPAPVPVSTSPPAPVPVAVAPKPLLAVAPKPEVGA